MVEKILADIRAIGRIKKSIKEQEQIEAIKVAKNRLIREMKAANYQKEADRIEEVFHARLW